jgi:HAD superfamily hydrolase (TIGR01509 family)
MHDGSLQAVAIAPIDFEPTAVLFDMDGLMIESERALLDCWRQAAVQLRFDLGDELWLAMVGLHERACDELLRSRLGEADAQALVVRMNALYAVRVEAGLPLKPGLHELLAVLVQRSLPKAVVTSTPRVRAEPKLARCGLLPHFATVVTGSDVRHPKPAPDIYLLAAQRLGVDPQYCVVLEDSAPGVRAALAAGMTPIQVPDLVAPDVEVRALGHRIVDSLETALALIEPALQRRTIAMFNNTP